MEADIVTLVKRKRFDEALAALAAGADPEPKKARGETALLWAVIHHRPDVARALLEAGADPSPRTTGKRAAGIGVGAVTPLHMAASDGDVGLIDVLVRGGATVDARDALGNTPLVLGAMRGHLDVVRSLVSAGADPNSSGAGYTALHMAAMDGRQELVSLLLRSGASVNPIQDDPWPPLRHAIVNGHKNVADLLRAYGAA
jgi:ankyrin repeat protein